MSCLKPILAVKYGVDPDTGKNIIKLLPRSRQNKPLHELKEFYGDTLLELPCGKCLNCAKDYARKWAVRICLEASLYSVNSFLTLTFDDEHKLDPKKDNLKLPFQNFIQKCRDHFGDGVRYFCVGELGDQYNRFHYHCIMFGLDFPDKVALKKTSSGQIIYRSKLLESLWSNGISSIGDVTPQSASYVARYSLKKKTLGINGFELVLMSRRPGIGARCFDLHWFDSEKIYSTLGESTIPRFYLKMLESIKPEFYKTFKEERLNRLLHFGDRRYFYGVDYLEELSKIEEDNLLKKQKFYRGN